MGYNLEDAINDTISVYKKCAGPVRLSEVEIYNSIKYRKSSCYAWDFMAASHSVNGGLPGGRIIEIFGNEGCGKTTFCVLAAAKVQKQKKRNKVLYLDAEHKLDLRYAVSLGLKEELTYFEQPQGDESGIYALQLLINAASAEDVGLIVVDSVSAILSPEELNGELDAANIGASARLWSKAIRKTSSRGDPYSPPIILINQLRSNIGGYGATEVTAGAKAIKFFAALRVNIHASEKLVDKHKNGIGQRMKFSARKNQVGTPFLSEETDLYFGYGFDNIKWLVRKAVSLKILSKGGAVYSFGAHKFKKSEMYEYMTDKIQQELYILCVEANRKRMEETAKSRKANPFKGKVTSSKEAPSKQKVNSSDDGSDF